MNVTYFHIIFSSLNRCCSISNFSKTFVSWWNWLNKVLVLQVGYVNKLSEDFLRHSIFKVTLMRNGYIVHKIHWRGFENDVNDYQDGGNHCGGQCTNL